MKNYTPKQIFIIRNAIEKGRNAMAIFGNNAETFAKAFIAADGIQVPGEQLDKAVQKRINDYVLKSLTGKLPFINEPSWVIDIIGREVDRVQSEVTQAILRAQNHVAGFSFAFSENVTDKEFCSRIASTDLYGLGPGIFPKDEIVVLPPGCDQIWWEAVNETQALASA